MRTSIIKLDPSAAFPISSAADLHRLADDSHLCIFQPLTVDNRHTTWWPHCLRALVQGRVTSRTGGMSTSIDDQTFEVVEEGSPFDAEPVAGTDAVMMVLIPARSLLARLGSDAEDGAPASSALFAARYGREFDGFWLLRQVSAECFVSESAQIDDHGATERLLRGVLAMQSECAGQIARCPGRQLAQRRELFARLQRVRMLLASDFRGDLNIEQMSTLAQLSPTHFIRVYKQVFGETPHRSLAQAKVVLAKDMLAQSERTVTAISRSLGFENRCAFARWFKKETGESATSARARLRLQTPAVGALAPSGEGGGKQRLSDAASRLPVAA